MNVSAEMPTNSTVALTTAHKLKGNTMLPQLSKQNNSNEVTITLKEITDLISVEHNKAMKVVEKLTEEPSFGGVEKMATPTYNPNGTFNKNIDTYRLTKKQAIATGAKLNNTLLMKIIDRLEELENSNRSYKLPQNFSEALRLAADLEDENLKLKSANKEKDKVILAVAELNIKAGDISVSDFSKNLAIKGFGSQNMFKWLKARGFLMMNTAPYQPYVERGYFTRKPYEEKVNDEVKYKTMITPRGQVWLTKMIRAEFGLDENAA